MVEEKVYDYRKASNVINTALLALLPCLADGIFTSPFFLRTPLNKEIWKLNTDNFMFIVVPIGVTVVFWFLAYGLFLIQKNERMILSPSGIEWVDWLGHPRLSLSNGEIRDIQVIPADSKDRDQLSLDNRGKMDLALRTDVCIIVGTVGDIRFSSLVQNYEELVKEVKRRLPSSQ